MSDKSSSIRILDDAKRLNMMDGHFVWLWIDTAAVINVKNSTDEVADMETQKRSEFDEVRLRRHIEYSADSEELRISQRPLADDIDIMNINYLLQNDQFLLFNSNNMNGGTSRPKKRRSDRKQKEKDGSASRGSGSVPSGKLPTGLLSLKPLPLKVDRHLVKGAVRLLVSVLKNVLDRSPAWMIRNLVTAKNNGCWKNFGIKESSFVMDFGK